MEYVPGANHSWIIHPKRNPEPIPPRVILGVIGAVADALDVAFYRPSTVTNQPLNVLHRDIKPANIRVTPDGEVKLLDFGIARAGAETVEREACTTEYQLGSLPYMAPELMDGSEASPGTDVYSLGVTLYESLARKRFGWAGESLDMHQNQIDTRMGELEMSDWEGITDDVIEMCRLMLAYDPEERPTAKEVSEVCRELSRKSPGTSIEAWAADALNREGIGDEGEGSKGELTGETLFEDITSTGGPPAPELDNLDDDTIAYPMGGNKVRRKASESALKPAHIIVVLVMVFAGWFLYTNGKQQVSTTEAATMAVEAMLEAQAEAQAQAQAEAQAEAVVAMLEAQAEADAEAEAVVAMLEAQAEADAEAQTEEQAAPQAQTVTARPLANPTQAAQIAAPEQPTDAGLPVLIRILSSPMDIEVLVDGNPVGRTPVRDLELSQGEHVITFVDGENSIRETIIVTEGGKTRWKYLQAGHVVQ
jgi:hypothetical protein